MNISELSASQLRRAADLKDEIAKLYEELKSILGTTTPAPTTPDGRKKKRTMSAAAKKKLSEFHKARWAKLKGATAHGKAHKEEVHHERRRQSRDQ